MTDLPEGWPKDWPKDWSLHEGRDPEKELRSLQQRFRAIRHRYEYAVKFRNLSHAVRASASGAAIVAVLSFSLVFLSPFGAQATLQHLAALPACDAARAVGVAPSKTGEPGYWPQHDADKDGIACEPLQQGARFVPIPAQPSLTQWRPADRDCRDFASHDDAQAFFHAQGPRDPHRLDEDRDGIACEALR